MIPDINNKQKAGAETPAQNNTSNTNIRYKLTPEETREILSDPDIAQKYSFVPRKYQKMFLRAMAGKITYRDLARLNCLECMAYQSKETEACNNGLCVHYGKRELSCNPKTQIEGGRLSSRPSKDKAGGEEGIGKDNGYLSD